MYLLFQLTLLSSTFLLVSANATSSIEGLYWTEDKEGIIELYHQGDELRGRIRWRATPLLDEKNPDANLRGRSMLGVTFLTGFAQEQQEWRGGRVYSADNGRTYRGTIWLEEEGQVLKMRGYIGIALLGRTASFRRLANDETIPEDAHEH